MVAMPAVEHPLPAPDVLQTFLGLETPPGFKAELVEGEIVVTPPPDGSHGDAISELAKQFFRQAEIDLSVTPNKGLITPGGRFIPDGTIAQTGHFRNAPSWAETDGVLLVFEITSGSPHKDRVQKRRGYAAAGIPCYLLVDRSAGQVVLFANPEEDVYTSEHSVKFGDPLDLPAPFSFALDTAPLR